MNTGKVFETAIKKSIPDYALLYRLPDSAQSFGRSENLRFSAKNPFDYILWDSKRKTLYALEMKTVGGKSISFERSKEEKGLIHHHQIAGLNAWNKFDGVVAGFIIEFRQIEKTVFIDIDTFNQLMHMIPKKSFNYDDLNKLDISHFIIPQTKARKRYSYDIDFLLSNIDINK